ncbi:hypothetical protein BdWA1_000932 [Babesia duncani]|uniref:Uncharacterized protein n=1 Tax=Babesia duncani TaxID=323732 RepID=A0AAD9PNB9_9APIC|nr:hypothetical protein BdWA1_000932 [Babesia duncani]
MAKKNNKKKILQRQKVIKDDFVNKSRRKEQKAMIKHLEQEMKAQVCFKRLWHLLQLDTLEIQPGSSMLVDCSSLPRQKRSKNNGVNFSRNLESSHPITSRQKKVLQRMLKRQRKIGG